MKTGNSLVRLFVIVLSISCSQLLSIERENEWSGATFCRQVYLGVTLDRKMNFKSHFNKTALAGSTLGKEVEEGKGECANSRSSALAFSFPSWLVNTVHLSG